MIKFDKRSGVSPVIAIILMVAITVVLTAVLYAMVSNIMIEVETTPKGSFNPMKVNDGTNWTIFIESLAGKVRIVDAQYILRSATNGSNLEDADLSDPPNNIVTFNSNNDNFLDAHDSFFIDSTKGVVRGDVFVLIYKPTGDIMITTTLK
jgi:flagellin-like protein